LDKRFQKKDWSKRPLPEEMIDYAAQDSAYLLPLAKTLIKALKNLNRLYWVEEECALLSQVRPAQANHQPLYLHFKGAGTLAPKELAVLEALLQLRKENAMQRDKPLFKIFQNPCIIKIVKAKPVTLHQLKKINAFSNTQLEIYGEDVVDAVIQALKIPPSDLPLWPRRRSRPLRGVTQARIKNLKEWKDKKAEILGIDPSLVLNKALITAISEKNPGDMETLSRIDNIKQWQIKEFGEEILNVLRNKGGYGTKHNLSGR
jgi:ribonuclease D